MCFCALIEILVFLENFDAFHYTLFDKKLIYAVTFGYIFIRDIAILVFFLWVEYFNRIIIMYHKQKIIHHREMSLLIEKQNFEKMFSRKKLFPHYFFNILEHLYAKSVMNNNDNELFDKLKFTLFYFLVDAEKEKIELDKEIVFYKYYIDLENFRHQKNVSVNFNVLGEAECFFIIPLLFEPIINNAMKYASNDGTGWVDIKLDTTSFPKLYFSCKNNFEPQSLSIPSSENGLKILKQRLELCYKNNYTLTIIKENNVYDVSLLIKATYL